VLAATVLDFGVDVDQDDRDPDRNRCRLAAFLSWCLEVVGVVEVKLLNWREP
jgi:hypothetical protein